MAQLDDLLRAMDRQPVEVEAPDARLASVAAVFTRQLELLFILRAQREGDPWSGHVGFPGGHAEHHDDDALQTAIRETREELGLVLERPQSVGQLDDVAPITGLPTLIVRPFVFLVDGVGHLDPNHEVAGVHHLHLDALLAGRGRSTFVLDWKRQKVTLPHVEFDGQRLWGLTLRVVDGLLDRIDGRGIGLQRNAR